MVFGTNLSKFSKCADMSTVAVEAFLHAAAKSRVFLNVAVQRAPAASHLARNLRLRRVAL